jgi:hypothetical protein
MWAAIHLSLWNDAFRLDHPPLARMAQIGDGVGWELDPRVRHAAAGDVRQVRALQAVDHKHHELVGVALQAAFHDLQVRQIDAQRRAFDVIVARRPRFAEELGALLALAGSAAVCVALADMAEADVLTLPDAA